MPPSTILHLGHIVAVLRRSPATVEHQDRHHAVVLTELPLGASAGSEIEGVRVYACQELGGAGVTVLGSVEPEDVRLLPLRCVNASASVYEGT